MCVSSHARRPSFWCSFPWCCGSAAGPQNPVKAPRGKARRWCVGEHLAAVQAVELETRVVLGIEDVDQELIDGLEAVMARPPAKWDRRVQLVVNALMMFYGAIDASQDAIDLIDRCRSKFGQHAFAIEEKLGDAFGGGSDVDEQR